ncbi:bacteriohemerythrin [Desulfovibrio sp. JC010]|uniref:bacteriohemerythrin n=1 Tax=Desulfovibrio sp. JC010 TaxID=2593641 RepID=UPI0013D40F11|nr:bacteriohemerythrin [Desulfovibrio sp. JC010]NDV27045.1 bacteriohemerythrin [Desulfovibrio sp. JC010]
MAKIEWHDGLGIGVEEIDDQHKSLIGMVNDVLDAFGKGEKDAAIDDLLSKLKEYAVLHFNTEEKYMEEIEYPQLAEHHQLHEELKNRVKALQAARFHREEVTPKDVKELLADWLVEHLLQEDYKIAQFAKDNKGEFVP